MTHAPQVLFVAMLACFWCARVRAQFGTTATVDPEMAATNRVDPTASGTELTLDNRVRAFELLRGVLAEAPGARPVLFGAPGSFTGLSLRGTDFQHTTVLLGELPLSNTDTGLFDFSVTPTSDFDRLEVFRGGAPAWFSTGAIGGVVRLIPREDDQSNVGATFEAASFDTYLGQVEGSVVTPRVNAYNNVTFFSTQADFVYKDDNGTLFEPEDDIKRRVPNADRQDLRGFSHVRVDTGAGELQTVFFGVLRDGGQPGPLSMPAFQTERRRSQLFGALSFVREGTLGPQNRAYRLQVMAGGGFVRDQFVDLAEPPEVGLGIPKDTDDRFGNLYGRIAAKIEHSPHVEWTFAGTVQQDWVNPENKADARQAPKSARTEAAFVLEPRVHSIRRDVRLELRPSVRFGFSHAKAREKVEQLETSPERNYFLPTIRVAGAIGPRPWLTFAASVFTGTSLPTILQLFGDRALITGNPTLTPERSVGGDISVVARGTVDWLSGSLETRFFRLSIDDLILGNPNGQNQIRFENEETADLLGLEVGARGDLTRYAVFTAALTYLQSRNSVGNALPFRSPFTALARLEGHTRELNDWVADLVAYAEVRHTKSGYRDAANTDRFPTRTTLELGTQAAFFGRDLIITFTVRNVLDVRTFDVLGFTLPGRSFAISIAYQKEFGS